MHSLHSGLTIRIAQHPASTWESESHFNAGQAKDHVLAVVNDSAERAMAFIEKFNTGLHSPNNKGRTHTVTAESCFQQQRGSSFEGEGYTDEKVKKLWSRGKYEILRDPLWLSKNSNCWPGVINR